MADRRLDLVQALMEESSLRHAIQDDYLNKFPDLNRLAKKFQRGTANLQDVVRVYQVVAKLPFLNQVLMSYQGDAQSLFEQVFTSKLKVISIAY